MSSLATLQIAISGSNAKLARTCIIDDTIVKTRNHIENEPGDIVLQGNKLTDVLMNLISKEFETSSKIPVSFVERH